MNTLKKVIFCLEFLFSGKPKAVGNTIHFLFSVVWIRIRVQLDLNFSPLDPNLDFIIIYINLKKIRSKKLNMVETQVSDLHFSPLDHKYVFGLDPIFSVVGSEPVFVRKVGSGSETLSFLDLNPEQIFAQGLFSPHSGNVLAIHVFHIYLYSILYRKTFRKITNKIQ